MPERRQAGKKWLHRLRVLEAAILLCATWPAVLLLPFRLMAPLLGTPRPPTADLPANRPGPGADAARAVRDALNAADRRLPWTCTCLMRTVAGRIMLKRRGVASIARLGVTGEANRDRAHAWLVAVGVDVTGGTEARGYVPVAEFVADRNLS